MQTYRATAKRCDRSICKGRVRQQPAQPYYSMLSLPIEHTTWATQNNKKTPKETRASSPGVLSALTQTLRFWGLTPGYPLRVPYTFVTL